MGIIVRCHPKLCEATEQKIQKIRQRKWLVTYRPISLLQFLCQSIHIIFSSAENGKDTCMILIIQAIFVLVAFDSMHC